MSSSGIDRAFERRLASLINAREPRVLQGGLKGVEKESLRVSPDGQIEQSDHPRELGSALTHEHITTDYSEALIELVTPANSAIRFRSTITRVVSRMPARSRKFT